MKRKIIIILIITNIILIVMLCNIINRNGNLIIQKQAIKEMSQSTLEEELNNTITQLNAEHTDYMNYIQTGKNTIATVLTNEGVITSNQETLETMATNIGKVLQARTSDATATASDIADGKTAYVNGTKIIGTGEVIESSLSNLTLVELVTNDDTYSSTNPYIFTEDYIALLYSPARVITLYKTMLNEVRITEEQVTLLSLHSQATTHPYMYWYPNKVVSGSEFYSTDERSWTLYGIK